MQADSISHRHQPGSDRPGTVQAGAPAATGKAATRCMVFSDSLSMNIKCTSGAPRGPLNELAGFFGSCRTNPYGGDRRMSSARGLDWP